MKSYLTEKKIIKPSSKVNSRPSYTTKYLKSIFVNHTPNVISTSSSQTIIKKKQNNQIPNFKNNRNKNIYFIQKVFKTSPSTKEISSLYNKKMKFFTRQASINSSRNKNGRNKIIIHISPSYNGYFLTNFKNDNKFFRTNRVNKDIYLIKKYKLNEFKKLKKSNSQLKEIRNYTRIKTEKNDSSYKKNLKSRNSSLKHSINSYGNKPNKKQIKTGPNITKNKAPKFITIDLVRKPDNNIISKNSHNEHFKSILNKKVRLKELAKENKLKNRKVVIPISIKKKNKAKKVSHVNKNYTFNAKNKLNNKSYDYMISKNNLNITYSNNKNDILDLNNYVYMDNNKFENTIYKDGLFQRNITLDNYGRRSHNFIENLSYFNINNNYTNCHVNNNNFNNNNDNRLSSFLSIVNVNSFKFFGEKKSQSKKQI